MLDLNPNAWKRLRKWLRRLVPIRWLLDRFWYRWHMLDMRTPMYAGGWCDRSELMFYACFNLLKLYVEREKPFEVIDWEWSSTHARAGRDIRELYEWWTKGRAEEHAEVEALLEGINLRIRTEKNPDGLYTLLRDPAIDNNPKWHEWVRRSGELEEKDQAQLVRLIELRRFLWT